MQRSATEQKQLTHTRPAVDSTSIIKDFIYEYDILTKKQFQIYEKNSDCMLIKNGMKNWNAMHLWKTHAYFNSIFKEKLLPIETYDAEGYKIDKFKIEMMPYREFESKISASDAKRKYYFADAAIYRKDHEPDIPELSKDIEIPKFIDFKKLWRSVAFIGKNSISECHYHTRTHALLCQVYGKKIVKLYPPSLKEFYFLYPKPWNSWYSNWSKIDFSTHESQPDLQQFPDYLKAKEFEFILEEGDMLYIPIYWWHRVYGIDLSMSVTHFWKASVKDCHFNRLGIRSLNILAPFIFPNRP